MSTIEEKIFFRVLRLYEEKRQPGDPAADSEMRHGVCAWIRREGVDRRRYLPIFWKMRCAFLLIWMPG